MMFLVFRMVGVWKEKVLVLGRGESNYSVAVGS